jgi:hypothetical protein
MILSGNLRYLAQRDSTRFLAKNSKTLPVLRKYHPRSYKDELFISHDDQGHTGRAQPTTPEKSRTSEVKCSADLG